MEPTAIRAPRLSRADIPAVLALLLGVGLRVGAAWTVRGVGDPDTSVVALMARHIAALKELPVFFYGQAYMGSLEPLASALMIRLLGSTGFAVALGPALFSAAALFCLWRWARDAAGPWGGFAAVLAGLFGPAVYFQFQTAARGGYMVALFVDACAIWSAARLAARLRGGERVGWERYFALGLLAGLGLWSNMIVVSALAVAVLLLAHGMRGRFGRHPAGLVSGLAGFAVGFSPWLAWNARHGWESLAASQIGGHAPLREALFNLWNRFLLLQGAPDAAPGSIGPEVPALAMLGLAAVGAGVAVLRRRREAPGENAARAGAVLFCVVFALVFATSGFTRTHTARYWVPLVPGLAVLAAVACAAPGGRARRAAAWILLAVLVGWQGATALPGMAAANRKSATILAGQREIGAALERAGVDALLAPIQYYPLNFALDERFAVSNGRQKFYGPVLRRAELAEAPAYLSDYNGIGAFLARQGAEWRSIAAGRRTILSDVRRPAVAGRELPAAALVHLRDGAGRDWKAELTDRNVDTVWSPGSTGAVSLECAFSEPQNIRALRLVFAHTLIEDAFYFPRRIRVEAEIAGAWRTLLRDEPINPLEWSGPRVYFPGGLAQPEFPLAARGARALRLTLLGDSVRGGNLDWRLAEVVAWGADDSPAAAQDSAAVAALGEWLRARAPEDAIVYAPRWVSNRLLVEGLIPEERLAGLAAWVFSPGAVARDGSVAADRSGVFVVESRFADATRATLRAHGADFRSDAAGPWSLFAVAAGGWLADGLDLPPAAQWTGEALLQGGSHARVAAALRRLRAGGESDKMQQALLGEIVRWRPSALAVLPEDQVARLGGATAADLRRAAAQWPDEPVATDFANGIRLEGVAVAPAEVRPGDTLEVRLHWSAREGFAPGREIVFVHLRDRRGRIVAQEDYRGSLLLWGDPSFRPIPGEGIRETRELTIPAGAPPGELDLAVGLYQPGNGFRVRIRRSAAPQVRRRAVLWPERVRVVP